MATPQGPRARLTWTGAGVAGLAAVGLAVYVGLGLSVAAWREHPHGARMVAVIATALLAVHCVHLVVHGAPEDDEEEDDDGGQRRPRSSPPRGPGPAAPVDPSPPPAPPWGEFDDLRSEWERTPAGVP
jgi:hypothetical protein